MKRPHENAILFFVGQKGSGKTTLLKKIVRHCRRQLVVDPERKWDGPGRVIEGEGLFTWLRTPGLATSPFRVIYRDRDVDRMRVLGPGAAFVVRNVTLVVDEMAWLSTARVLPDRLRWCVQFGRERGINLVGTTREPQEIHDMFFSQSDQMWFFRVGPGNGLDRIRRRYGREFAAALPGMKTHHFRTYGPNPKAVELLGKEGIDSSVEKSYPRPS